MSGRHVLKLSGGLLSDWLPPEAPIGGLCVVSGDRHVTAFLAELAAHWLPPRALSAAANHQRPGGGGGGSGSARLHWVSTLSTEEAARSVLQKFGARRNAATFSSARDILLSTTEDGCGIDRLLAHLIDRYAETAAIEGCDRPILVLEDASPLLYVGHSPAAVTHAVLRLCRCTLGSGGHLVIGCHASPADPTLLALVESLKSLAAFALTAEPLETGYLAEVDGRVTLTGPAVAAVDGDGCLGRWRSAGYHYFVTDRQVKCFPIGLSEFAAG